MSSIAKRLAKRKQVPEVYRTLVGSIVTTIGIITGKSESEVKKAYSNLKKIKKDMPYTVAGLCDYVWAIFGDDDKIAARANMVLVYDKLNIRSPLVTFVNENGNIMPLSPDGTFTGILMTAAAGGKYVGVEYLYNEDGSEIVDEEENKIDE